LPAFDEAMRWGSIYASAIQISYAQVEKGGRRKEEEGNCGPAGDGDGGKW